MGDHVGHAGLVATAVLLAGGCSLIDAGRSRADGDAAPRGDRGDSGDGDAAPVEDCAMSDDFEDGITDEAWEAWSDPGAQVTEVAGGVRVSFDADPAWGGYKLAAPIDLREGEVRVEVAEVGGAYTVLQVDLGSMLLSLYVEGGEVLIARVAGAGAADHVVPAGYVPTEDVFWRIRAEGGSVDWQVSRDADSWVTMYSAAAPFPLDEVDVSIAAAGVIGDPPAVFESFVMTAACAE